MTTRTLSKLLLWILLSCAQAHEVSQLYMETQEAENSWTLTVNFDAGYAKKEWRDDLEKPQPKRSWLVALTRQEQDELCQEAATYLQEILDFGDHEPTITFPDFNSDPPDFPDLLIGGAYFHVTFTVPASPFTLTLSEKSGPDFAIKRDGKFITLTPGESLVFGENNNASSDGQSLVAHSLTQGYLHVLPQGLDHCLFILALFLYARKARPLLWQSLAFTIAHTLTLGLTMGGVINPPSNWIEPLIAISIGLLAAENLFSKGRIQSLRIVLVFGFGLIHGMGFAGALAGTFGEGDHFLLRLLMTNLGVELAQVTILGAAWIVTIHWHQSTAYPKITRVLNIALIITSLWWAETLIRP